MNWHKFITNSPTHLLLKLVLITTLSFLLYSFSIEANDFDNIPVTQHRITNTEIPSSWTHWKQKNQLSVSYRKSDVPKLIEINAQAIVNSSLSAFLLFLQDTPNIPNWLHNAKSSTVIKQYSTRENMFINHFNGFWPVKPREMVVRSQYWQNEDLSVEIAVQDAGNEYEGEDLGAIRMQVHEAHWKITPLNNNNIYIQYIFTVDAKGSLPKWISENAALKGIWKTLNNLESQLPSSPWQEKRLTYINEYDG